MTNIAKHDSEEEGEGDDGKETRIGLLVVGNTISLNNFLSGSCKTVGDKMRGKSFGTSGHKLSNCMFGGILKFDQSPLQSLNITIPNINFPLHKIAIQFHLIQSNIDIFLLDDVQFQILMSSEILAIGHGLGQSLKEIVQLCLGEVEETGGLVDAVE